MDVVCNSISRSRESTCLSIMDNDSGYVSNNLDQESNSDSINETLNNSSVEILKSFFPKSIYISEDALLERPDMENTMIASPDEENNPNCPVWDSVDLSSMINSNNITKTHAALPSFDSFRSDSGNSNYSLASAAVKPVYYNLNSTVKSPPICKEDECVSSDPSDGPFFGFENVPLENANQVFKTSLVVKSMDYANEASVVENTSKNSIADVRNDEILLEKSSQNVHNDSAFNIDQLPVFIDGNNGLIELPLEYNSTSFKITSPKCVNLETIPEKAKEYCEEVGITENVSCVSSNNSGAKDESLVNVVDTIVSSETCKEVEKKLENLDVPQNLLDKNSKIVNAEIEEIKEKLVGDNEVKGGPILNNVTNIKIRDILEVGPSKISTYKRSISIENKENLRLEAEVNKTPIKSRKRKLSEIGSPYDLFSDSECSTVKPPTTFKPLEERFVHKFDQRLIKRVQKTLGGVPPPPNLMITRLTVNDMLEKLEANKNLFWTKENLEQATNDSLKDKSVLNESQNTSLENSYSILVEGRIEDVVKKEFPEVLYSRNHGLHHNRNRISEEIEHLCEKYAKRYIGAETQSSCTSIETEYLSPNKRKSIKPKWPAKSPGRRLSHLATKRRITFSSASLQAGTSFSAASRARQILIDYKKLEVLNKKKSPKKTPLRSPRLSPGTGRTPSSSAKKKLITRFRLLSGDFNDMMEPSPNISNFKRALFQSPDKDSKFKTNTTNIRSSVNAFERDLASGGGVKRSLFSSPKKIASKTFIFPTSNKQSPFKIKSSLDKKRKRDDDDDENNFNQPKFFRSHSSYGYSEGEHKAETSFTRTRSESVLTNSRNMGELSDGNKKKLQWAVYDSLKDQNVTPSHTQFKVFASVLARVIRRCIVSENIRLEASGTSEKMLRIARRHVYSVVKGKSVEEIMSEVNKNKIRNMKPRGYVAPQDYIPASSGREFALRDRDSNSGDSEIKSSTQTSVVKSESRIDKIRKVINFEDRK